MAFPAASGSDEKELEKKLRKGTMDLLRNTVDTTVLGTTNPVTGMGGVRGRRSPLPAARLAVPALCAPSPRPPSAPTRSALASIVPRLPPRSPHRPERSAALPGRPGHLLQGGAHKHAVSPSVLRASGCAVPCWQHGGRRPAARCRTAKRPVWPCVVQRSGCGCINAGAGRGVASAGCWVRWPLAVLWPG